ncbi:response regulator transcription factor [Oceanospirillum sp. HFRX-1_2]
MNILLIDDHPVFSDALAMMLEARIEDTRVLCHYSVKDAIGYLDSAQKVDLILVDIQMPTLDGIAFIGWLKRTGFNIPCAAVSGVDDPETILEFRNSGGQGYISKSASYDQLIKAVKALAAGREYFPSLNASEKDEMLLSALTNKQLKIVMLLQDGHSYAGVAEAMGISINTVKSHVRNIYELVGVSSKIACLNKLKELGVIS